MNLDPSGIGAIKSGVLNLGIEGIVQEIVINLVLGGGFMQIVCT